jgi:hypothetical protein
MADNEHSLPSLRDAETAAVKHLPFAVIPQVRQGPEDRFEGPTAVVAEQSLDVLKDSNPGLFSPKDSTDLKKERPSGVLESTPAANKRESLTREACGEYFMVWDLLGDNLPDVFGVVVANLELA